MKTNILFVILLSAITTSCISQKAVNTNYTDEEAAITAVVKTLENGWNTKSGELFASRFAKSADYIIWDGTFIPEMSKEMNIRAHQGIFDGVYRNSELYLEVVKIKFLRPDLVQASVNGWNYQKGAERPEDPLLLMTMILDKSNGEWEIVSFHNADIHIGRMSDPNAREWYTSEEQKVKAVASEIVAGWNERDAAKMGATLTENCAFSVSDKGYNPATTSKEVEEAHARLFAHVLKENGKVKIEDSKVQFLDGDLAMVNMKLSEPSPKDPSKSEVSVAQLTVERDSYGKWLIRSLFLAPMNLEEER